MKSCIRIGIGGVSTSGKTTLSNLLKAEFETYFSSVSVLSMDDYTVEKDKLPQVRDRLDWDHPDSIDWNRLLIEFDDLCSSNDVIIVEGIFAYYDKELSSKYDHSIFLKIKKSEYLERRRLESRWGKEPDWYLEHVWTAYEEFGIPEHDVITLEGSKMWVVNSVMKKLGFHGQD